jgi:hypothetical protein
MSLAGAQQAASGSGITVAVIDTGTADLPQFAGQLTEGPSGRRRRADLVEGS